MRELGLQSISGAPGTAAALTLGDVAGNPRMSAIAPVGSPIHYVVAIESTGQMVCRGVGFSTGAGGFTRVMEFATFDGADYTTDPASFGSIPAGCVIYCSGGATDIITSHAPVCGPGENLWFDPAGPNNKVSSATWTVGAVNRDYFWRDRIVVNQKIDQLAMHASAASGVIDFAVFEVNWATGKAGKLLLGWQGVTLIAGMTPMLLSAATLGALPKAAQRLPIGDVFFMANWSNTTGQPGRVKDGTGSMDGSLVADLASPQHIQYVNRTNGTAFGDNPTITGRIASSYPNIPLVAARAA
jgi:hypothetical protein